MPYAVRLNDLGALSPREREDVLSRLANEANERPNGQLDAATARIRAFEQRYEVSSSTLLDRLKRGEQRETAEIAEWLFYLRLVSLGKE